MWHLKITQKNAAFPLDLESFWEKSKIGKGMQDKIQECSPFDLYYLVWCKTDTVVQRTLQGAPEGK